MGVSIAATREEAVLVEQLKTLYVEGQRLIWTGVAASVMLVAVLWGQVHPAALLGWLAFFLAYAAFRVGMLRAFRRADGAEPRTWLRRVQLAQATGGSTWAAAGILFFLPDQVEYNLFLSVCMFGGAVSGLVTLAVHLRSYVIFVTPIAVAAILRNALENDPLHWGIAAGSLVLVVIFINFGRFIERSFVESHLLRMELAERNLELERANQAKTRFLAAASHDLRQPLHAMGLFVDAIDHAVEGERPRRLVSRLRDCTHALDDLLGGLLDVSKLDSGVVEARTLEFALGALLARLDAEFQPVAAEKGLALRTVPTTLHVRSDPELVERMLRNLLANAIHHTAAGRVLVGCRRHGGQVRVEVWDTGRGMPENRLDEIFDEFVQLERDDLRPGLGLGLAIVQRSAMLVGSRVDVRSQPGRGSVFSFALPRVADADAKPRPPGEPDGPQELGGRTVLIVDDDTGVREGMAEALRAWGCTVATAASVDEAERHLQGSNAVTLDAAVVDYQLPGGATGLDVARRLDGLPAVLITGDTSGATREQVQAAGLPLLHKPVKPEQLRAVLATLLDEREERPAET